MKTVVLYAWLVMEFFLIAYGIINLTGMVFREEAAAMLYIRMFLGLVGGLFGVVMNFHPCYKFKLKKKMRTEVPPI